MGREIIIGLFLVLQGCKPIEEYRMKELVEPQAKFQVKGFYIGMSQMDFRTLIASKFTDVIPKCALKKGEYDCNGATFDFDSSGLVEFSFGPKISNKLFKSHDMDADTFAQEFIDSYKVPNLTVQERPMIVEGVNFGNITYWEYRSPDGYLLAIGGDKSVLIKKIPKQSDRKFD